MLLDFHTHITTRRPAESVLAHIRAYGGERSVVLPIAHGDCAAHDDGWRIELAIEAHDHHGDAIIPFCHVNPLATDALDQICRHHATGLFRGFGEHKVRIACDHPMSVNIYRLCGELGWPVLLHFDYNDHHNYNIEAFASVLESCPDTTFVGHAQSWWANVSAQVVADPSASDFEEYPKGPVVRGGLVDRWLGEYPNLHTDLSARSAYNALTRDPEFGKSFVQRHHRKLLWGSDCPCLDGKGNLHNGSYRDCLSGLTLPVLRDYCETDKQYDNITHRNAERLLGLSPE